MPRYALKIEYNGQGFHGWQRQQGLPSVQGTLELALLALEPDLPGLVAAGRTDTGVHGLGQVAHCDMHKDWICERLKAALNFHIRPHHISIIDCVEVAPDWHARFSAVGRDYLFRLVCRSAPVTHDAGRVWQTRHNLDVPAMREAVKYLLGTHDFTTFRSTMCQANSPIKTLDAINITERDYANGKEIQFSVQAKSFLHNQVRSLVGTLERVGAKSWTPERVKQALEAADRAACGPVCPPDGLYLKNVRYPQDPFAR
ncbi:tRNA pseudouridine(38-40) synthase TruA [Planktomarina sp.]|nr:tRNA pseudouridine(38-40) synthase TruA [Planktomarina sp.]